MKHASETVPLVEQPVDAVSGAFQLEQQAFGMIGRPLIEPFLDDRLAPFGGFAAIEGFKDQTSADFFGMFFRVGFEVDISMPKRFV
jgi:hypothetical protein